MARKPLAEKTVAENCLKYGTGGINIDESRVETSENITIHKGNLFAGNSGIDTENNFKTDGQSIGRFPANLIHDNSEEVRECFPETKSGGTNGKKAGNKNCWLGVDKEYNMNEPAPNSGNASRFFKSIIYQAKASKSERNKGCEELEEKEYTMSSTPKRQFIDGVQQAVDFTTKQLSNKNNHPTVKPIALMEYLIKMVTPKGGIVLDPFAGSGSTLVSAKENGYQYIGIERESEYIEIIKARLNN